MTKKRQLRFLFQEPGMLEAVAVDPSEILSNQTLGRGYRDSSIPDLMIDFRMNAIHPFAWISYNFHKTYPSVIWGLKLLMADEMFDVPQANLTSVPLHEAFSWAYAHFVLEDEVPATPVNTTIGANLTRKVLHYAAEIA